MPTRVIAKRDQMRSTGDRCLSRASIHRRGVNATSMRVPEISKSAEMPILVSGAWLSRDPPCHPRESGDPGYDKVRSGWMASMPDEPTTFGIRRIWILASGGMTGSTAGHAVF